MKKITSIPCDLFVQTVERAKDIIVITKARPVELPGPEIVYVNKAFEKLTGYTRKEAIGQTPRILQGKDTCKKTTNRIHKALKKSKIIREVILNYTKSGKSYWLDMAIYPLHDEKNKVTYFAAIERDVTKEKQAEEKLKAMSMLDSLTNVSNRYAFFLFANKIFNSFKRKENPFSLLMIDVDNYKQINDKYGHLVGDRLLKSIAKVLVQQVRKSDMVARYGGDEFIIILPNTTLSQGKKVVEKIKSKLKELSKKSIIVTASMGLVEVTKQDSSIEKVIRRADKLLFKEKRR